MAVGVPHARGEQILVPAGGQAARAIPAERQSSLGLADAAHGLRRRVLGHAERHLRVIPAHDEEPRAVGGEDHVVGPVLAPSVERSELLDPVERVISVGIGDPVQAAARTPVADDIEGVERPEKSLGSREIHRNAFDDGGRRSVRHGRGDAHEALVSLIARDEPAPRVARQGDPRAKFLLRDDEEALDGEALRHVERGTHVSRGTGAAGEDVAPGPVAGLGDDAGGGRRSFGRLLPRGPGGIADDHRRRAIGGGQHEAAGEAGRPSRIANLRDELIVAVAQVRRQIDAHRALPRVTAAHPRAVNRQGHAVVAGRDEHGGPHGPAKRPDQPILPVRVRTPDPRCDVRCRRRFDRPRRRRGVGHALGCLLPAASLLGGSGRCVREGGNGQGHAGHDRAKDDTGHEHRTRDVHGKPRREDAGGEGRFGRDPNHTNAGRSFPRAAPPDSADDRVFRRSARSRGGSVGPSRAGPWAAGSARVGVPSRPCRGACCSRRAG